MGVEEKSKRVNKTIYRVELLLLKILPSLVALIYFTNTLLSLFYIDLPLLSYIAGMSLIPLVFIYISSYVFQFCEYHRLPLHYVVVNIIICSANYYIGLPISTILCIALHCCIFCIFMFTMIFLYLKSKYETINQRIA
jgi:hypothetical protein